VADNPFRALGLSPDPGLTDDDIRSAWHRVAAATHPDRADGGDPAAFSAAAAAYSELRTPFGRGEALAGLGRPARHTGPSWLGLLGPAGRSVGRRRRFARSGGTRRAGPGRAERISGTRWAGPDGGERTGSARRAGPAGMGRAGGTRRAGHGGTGLGSLPWAGRAWAGASAAGLAAMRWAARLRGGRPARLAALVLGGCAVSAVAVAADGWQPASLAVVVGTAVWVLRGGRHYLAAPLVRPLPGPAPGDPSTAGPTESGRTGPLGGPTG
jgi:hypothetical protein